MVLVLLSASVARVGVSRMQDFSLCIFYTKRLFWVLFIPNYCASWGSQQRKGPWLWLLAIVTYERWQVTGDRKPDTWHMTHDTWHTTSEYIFFYFVILFYLLYWCYYQNTARDTNIFTGSTITYSKKNGSSLTKPLRVDIYPGSCSLRHFFYPLLK